MIIVYPVMARILTVIENTATCDFILFCATLSYPILSFVLFYCILCTLELSILY